MSINGSSLGGSIDGYCEPRERKPNVCTYDFVLEHRKSQATSTANCVAQVIQSKQLDRERYFLLVGGQSIETKLGYVLASYMREITVSIVETHHFWRTTSLE